MERGVTQDQERYWRAAIRRFVQTNMNAVDDGVRLRDDDNIFEKGYVSSLFAMRLLNFVESTGGVAVADEDIVLANFSSIDAMVSLIGKRKQAA
jgi:methoxymalonate biosynthesis acyl carrier protein